MSDHLHIVCLDCPSPPDYGGAIDMYYTITSLHAAGKKIILHYFNYKANRNIQELLPFCEQIYSYKRKSFLQSPPLLKPHIVSSRVNKKLIERLNEDAHPVLVQGIHCTAILPRLKQDKKIIIRLHNNEAVYYYNLAKAENNLLKKAYFKREARLLKTYQKSIQKHYPLACLSQKDAAVFKNEYGFQKTVFIPCFLPWQSLNIQAGKGEFFLYHGNLLVKENELAATWLIENVFKQLNLPFIIAGKGISKKLQKTASVNPHIKLVNDPPMEELDILIRNAHAHVLPSMNATGVKLKLLHALFEGRFCFTNDQGVCGSGLEKTVTVLDTATQWKEAISHSINTEFTEEMIEERKLAFAIYNNQKNAEKFKELL